MKDVDWRAIQFDLREGESWQLDNNNYLITHIWLNCDF